MDPETVKKRQALKVIITDSLMTLAAVALVGFLVLTVSGYWINENFEVTRSGMLQVSSMPTGATVTVDGGSLPQRTNTSRVVPVGEHQITIEKEGYDTWSKTVEVKDGLLYRLKYPRLFPNDREAEKVPVELDAKYISVSPKHDLALLVKESGKWSLVNLEEDRISPKTLDFSEIFSGGLSGDIVSFKWSHDQNRVLMNLRTNAETTTWLLLNLNDVKKSINLSETFGVGFSEINSLNNSADNLFALRNHNLQRIDINNKSISAILAEGVEKYYRFGEDIVFAAKNDDGAYIGLLKPNNDQVEKVHNIESAQANVLMSRFYDNKYLTVVDNHKVLVFKGDNLDEAEYVFDISFEPTTIKAGRDGDFVVMANGNSVATLDMEAEKLLEWQIEVPNFHWLDDNMLYIILDGQLVVYDFDGFNRRVLVNGVREEYPVTIAGEKWLYYVNDNGLVRESLRK